MRSQRTNRSVGATSSTCCSNGIVNIQSQNSTIYRARYELVAENDVEWSRSFSLIRSLLTCFRDLNIGTWMALNLNIDNLSIFPSIRLSRNRCHQPAQLRACAGVRRDPLKERHVQRDHPDADRSRRQRQQRYCCLCSCTLGE